MFAVDAGSLVEVIGRLFDDPVELEVDDLGHHDADEQEPRNGTQMRRASDLGQRSGGVGARYLRLDVGGRRTRHGLRSDPRNQGEGADEQRGAGQQGGPRIDPHGRPACDLPTGDPTDESARQNEREESARLSGMEHLVRPAPELAEDEQGDDRDPDVEDEADPGGWQAEEPPEQHQTSDHREGDARHQAVERDARAEAAVGAQDGVGDQGHDQIDEGQSVVAEAVDERGLADALGRHLEGAEEEGVAEQRSGEPSLLLADLGAQAAQGSPPPATGALILYGHETGSYHAATIPTASQYRRLPMPIPGRFSTTLCLALLLPLAFAASAGAADAPIEAKPGTVVRWAAEGTESCSEGERSWPPHGSTCYFPLDLEREGSFEIRRRRSGAQESATVVVADYPYRVQHIEMKDSSRVDLSAENLERAAAERERIDALWSLDTERRFEIPLGPPLGTVEARGSFGSRRFFNGQARSPHSGEDYRATTGTPVLAVAPGVVALAEEHFFGGKTVYLDHGDGLVSMYMHLSAIEVEAGTVVEAGRRVGKVGATGRVTGPHLHFGLRWRGARVDPAVLLGD